MEQENQVNKNVDFISSSNIETLTLGMGCFWSVEALFGHLPGVLRTRAGYSGGTTTAPTYRQMGDHTETIEFEFDPEIISLENILEVFWNNHNPININDYKGQQYRSLLLYHDEQQLDTIERVINQGKGNPETEIAPYHGFTLAEDRHQKYYLKRYPYAMEKVMLRYPSHDDFLHSTLVARLNGLAKGYTNRERIKDEINQWPIHSSQRDELIDLMKRIRW